MPKFYYENISKENFDKLFDACETLNEKFEFLNNYLLSYGIDEVDEREPTNVVNLLDNPAEDFIHHAREKFVASVLKEKEKYNEANVKQLGNEIVNPNEKADSEAQIAMQQFILNPAKYLSGYARFRGKELENDGESHFKNKDDLKRYQNNLKYVARQYYSINKIFNTNEKKRHVKDVLENSQKACNMDSTATCDDIVRHNKGGIFENLFNTTSKEYKEFVKAYKEFNDENSLKYGDDAELDKAARAYVRHKIPGFQLPNELPKKEDIERFSGTSRARLEFCLGVLQSIKQRFERNLMTTAIDGDLENDNKVNQNEFQSIVNKDINKDEIINNNNDLVESNEIQVENEAQSTNN